MRGVQVVSDLVPDEKAPASGQPGSNGSSEGPPAQLQLAAAWQVCATLFSA